MLITFLFAIYARMRGVTLMKNIFACLRHFIRSLFTYGVLGTQPDGLHARGAHNPPLKDCCFPHLLIRPDAEEYVLQTGAQKLHTPCPQIV